MSDSGFIDDYDSCAFFTTADGFLLSSLVAPKKEEEKEEEEGPSLRVFPPEEVFLPCRRRSSGWS